MSPDTSRDKRLRHVDAFTFGQAVTHTYTCIAATPILFILMRPSHSITLEMARGLNKARTRAGQQFPCDYRSAPAMLTSDGGFGPDDLIFYLSVVATVVGVVCVLVAILKVVGETVVRGLYALLRAVVVAWKVVNRWATRNFVSQPTQSEVQLTSADQLILELGVVMLVVVSLVLYYSKEQFVVLSSRSGSAGRSGSCIRSEVAPDFLSKFGCEVTRFVFTHLPGRAVGSW
jgi:hypothetical protein